MTLKYVGNSIVLQIIETIVQIGVKAPNLTPVHYNLPKNITYGAKLKIYNVGDTRIFSKMAANKLYIIVINEAKNA